MCGNNGIKGGININLHQPGIKIVVVFRLTLI